MMKNILTVGLLASLMMAGSALAMDSAAIEEHREKITENYLKTSEEKGEAAALEQRVEELEELIEMMLAEDEQSS